MRYSLLSVSTVAAINIGDYIQALAARQFLPSVDSFIEREQLKEYDGEETNVIMNAYYMHDGSHWPPSKKINPLFVAVHINKLAQEQMLTSKGIAYFKRHEPIGCRDLETERVLKSFGVDAYFSGCMTLTLGKSYKQEKKDGKIYFVDVKLPVSGRLEQIKLMMQSVFCIKEIMVIAKKMSYTKHTLRRRLGVWCNATKFYLHFRKIVDRKMLIEAEYLTQEDEAYNKLADNEARMRAAEELVKKYAQATLVITTRIHCALPCLAVETPVYYVYDDNMPYHSKCRLDGLVQLFNVIHWNGHELKNEFFDENNKIRNNNIIENKKTYLNLSEKLIERCEDFINKTQNT